jgi:hypothetical protein
MKLLGFPLDPLGFILFSTAKWAHHEDGCDREPEHEPREVGLTLLVSCLLAVNILLTDIFKRILL